MLQQITTSLELTNKEVLVVLPATLFQHLQNPNDTNHSIRNTKHRVPPPQSLYQFSIPHTINSQDVRRWEARKQNGHLAPGKRSVINIAHNFHIYQYATGAGITH